jgi:carboxylesterase type B
MMMTKLTAVLLLSMLCYAAARKPSIHSSIHDNNIVDLSEFGADELENNELFVKTQSGMIQGQLFELGDDYLAGPNPSPNPSPQSEQKSSSRSSKRASTAAATATAIATAPTTTKVDGSSGMGSARVWRGIPFAAPPVGPLRWQQPQSAQPLPPNTVLQAFTDNVGCIQHCVIQKFACPPKQSEDCLFLNVFAPREASITAPRPVMVFFHGGNFYQGWGGGPMYDSRFAANQTSTVVVIVNYRLGVLGFLNSPVLEGNYGIYDQQQALRWVRDNIAAFGGDPHRVTVFGQSAGSMSIAIHLTSPLSQGLFHAAILESEPFALPLRTTENWESQYSSDFAKAIGCVPSDLNCIYGKSSAEVLAGQNQIIHDLAADLQRPLELFVPFTPSIGSVVAPKQPIDALRAGEWNVVPLMIGNVAQEATLFIYEAFGKPVGELEMDVVVALIFGVEKGIDVAEKYYPPSPLPDVRPQVASAASDGLFFCPFRNITRHLLGQTPMLQLDQDRSERSRSISSHSNAAEAPIWYYIFDHSATDHAAWNPFTFCYNVTCHGGELPFVFHSFFHNVFNWSAKEAVLTEDVMRYWTNFAHCHDPNGGCDGVTGGKQPAVMWPKYADKEQNIHFQTPSEKNGQRGTYVETRWHGDTCDWWDANIGYHFA